eukprot:3267311-Pyramimonas_sp.AAC.1
MPRRCFARPRSGRPAGRANMQPVDCPHRRTALAESSVQRSAQTSFSRRIGRPARAGRQGGQSNEFVEARPGNV